MNLHVTNAVNTHMCKKISMTSQTPRHSSGLYITVTADFIPSAVQVTEKILPALYGEPCLGLQFSHYHRKIFSTARVKSNFTKRRITPVKHQIFNFFVYGNKGVSVLSKVLQKLHHCHPCLSFLFIVNKIIQTTSWNRFPMSVFPPSYDLQLFQEVEGV